MTGAIGAAGPRLVIHVGQHKTGSKALQSFLAHNRRALAARGVFYPVDDGDPPDGIRAYAISHFRLYALVRRGALAATRGPGEADAYARATGRYCAPFDSDAAFFAWAERGRRAAGAGVVVVSAEDLFDLQSAHEVGYDPGLAAAGAARLAGLAAEFGYEPRVVVYLRRQDHLLAAHYVQYIKGTADRDDDFATFARSFAPRLDSARVLEPWASAFGRDRVCVRPYERPALPDGIVPDFFRHALGADVPGDCTEPPADVESVNHSIDRDYVEFIRVLNRRAAGGGAVFERGAVLEAALRARSEPGRSSGVAAWLSPADRRALIDDHGGGNASIARDYLARPDGRLFHEPRPAGDDAWRPYPGFDADRATAVALAVHQAASPAPAVRADPPQTTRPTRGALARLFRGR